MRDDCFKRFKEEYDSLIIQRGTSNVFNTSFMTEIRTQKLKYINDDMIFDIHNLLCNPYLTNIILKTPNRQFEYEFSRDEFIDAICDECIENVFFFIRLILPNFMKLKEWDESKLKLNYGIISLIRYYDLKLPCILCNPRQTFQTTILCFLYVHATLCRGMRAAQGEQDSIITKFPALYNEIYNSIPHELRVKFFSKNKEILKNNDKYPKYMFIDDFEFQDFEKFLNLRNDDSKKYLIYGCGVVNKGLKSESIKFLEENTHTVYDDYEFYNIINLSQSDIYSGPITRIFFDTYTFFTNDMIKNFLSLFDGDVNVFKAEIFRERVINHKDDLIDKYKYFVLCNPKTNFRNKKPEYRIYAILYSMFTIQDLEDMDSDIIEVYFGLIQTILRHKNTIKLISEEDI